MGGAPSKPAPPPRLPRTLSSTTTWIQHLPPVISLTAREAIHAAISLRNDHLAGDESAAKSTLLSSSNAVSSQLEQAVREALSAANIRDYTALLIEHTVLQLVRDAGPPPSQAMDLARAVNPFLNRQGGVNGIQLGTVLPAPFRSSDTAMIAEEERDLLVLLYYCDPGNAKDCGQELDKWLALMTEKYGSVKELDLRKEPFSETEVYIFWAILYLTTHPGIGNPGHEEKATSLTRLLTVCEMLQGDGRMDQVCLLLTFLTACVSGQKRMWWGSRTRSVLRGLKKARPGRTAWHLDFAERTLKRLKKQYGGQDAGWGSRRSSVNMVRDELGWGRCRRR